MPNRFFQVDDDWNLPSEVQGRLEERIAGEISDGTGAIGTALTSTIQTLVNAGIPPAVAAAFAADTTISAAAIAAINAAASQTGVLITQALTPLSGYVRTWEDDNGRLAIGIRADGGVEISRPVFADSSLQKRALATDVQDALGQDLPSTSGYSRLITDQDGRLGFGLRLDGSVDIGKLNISPGFQKSLQGILDPIYNASRYVVDVVKDGSGNRQLVSHDNRTGVQVRLTTTGDNFAPVVVGTKVVFAQTGANTLLTVPVAGGVIAPATSIDDVAWWGDSLSAMGTPADLDALLTTASVYNGGVGSQTVRQIITRQGGIPVYVTLDGNQIPASGPVNVTMISPVDPAYNTAGWKFTINGVLGTLSARTSAPEANGDITAGTQTFTRDTPGSAVTVPTRALAVPYTGSQYASRTTVLWAGRNSVYTDAEAATLAPGLAAAIDYLTSAAKRVLILDVTNATDEGIGTERYKRITTMNQKTYDTYGLVADGGIVVPVRRNFIDGGLAALGITPTAADLAAIAVDAMPPSLMETGDKIHFNAQARAYNASKVYAAMLQKGWY